MSEYDLRLTGGTAVLPGLGPVPVDICISGGRIAALVEPGAEALPARETVRIDGRVVVPGAIDAHVHLGQDLSVPKTEQDAAAETASAAAGGVTTMLAYLMSPQPYEQLHEAARDLMGTYAHTDFGFHYCLVTPDQVRSIPRYVQDGVSSFKFFMNFRGEEGAYLGLPGNDDGFLLDLLTATAENGSMANPHAENIELVWRIRDRFEKRPDAGLAEWDMVRPSYVEAEAEQRVAYLAGVVGASLYAVHVTSAEALSALDRQRQRHADIFVETCPHYLTLDTTSPIGSRGKVNPPLRSAADQQALWAGVADGRVDVIGSDHVPRHFSAKDKDIWTASAGFPGVGTLLPLLVSEGHQQRGIALERLVELTSTRAAKLFGMYPRKGVIAVGADADLAVLDLDTPGTVEAATQLSGSGYSVWEGWKVGCRVQHTLLRGEFAVRDGVLQQARGEYVPRERSGRAALDAPAGVRR
ncbi:MAG TPA: amidohydrolase family protein [Mycobacteriales bacterium]|jgi:dihydropyrimidinase|nr:amidohydrolase family protein [Mycobacteriales bacterium]